MGRQTRAFGLCPPKRRTAFVANARAKVCTADLRGGVGIRSRGCLAPDIQTMWSCMHSVVGGAFVGARRAQTLAQSCSQRLCHGQSRAPVQKYRTARVGHAGNRPRVRPTAPLTAATEHIER